MLPKFTTKEEKEKYFTEKDDCGYKYEIDLLYAKIRITDVPFKYRTSGAYIYAYRAIRDTQGNVPFNARVEKKVIEEMLLRDIIKNRKKRPDMAESLESIYFGYYLTHAAERGMEPGVN